MATYHAGDYVKVELRDEVNKETEWLWVKVDGCDEENRVVFGRLDNRPLLGTDKLRLGQQIAVTFDRIRQHKRSFDVSGTH